VKKNKLVLLLILLTAFSSVSAQEILEYDAMITADDTVLFEDITITVRNNHESSLRRLTYPFSGDVDELKTFDNDGGLESLVDVRSGTNYVTTELRESIDTNENITIFYEFIDPFSVTFFNNSYILSTSFSLLANVKKFNLALRLPDGTGLGDPDVDVVPAPTEITSDGRAVILKWTENNPSDFRIFVRYNKFLETPPPTSPPPSTSKPPVQTGPTIRSDMLLLGLSTLMFLFFIILLVLNLKRNTRIKDKIDILKEDEQLILKIVADEDGIEQRELQRRCDFSKTKISKILSELEKREVIRKESMGKKNKVYLAHKLKE